MMLLILIVILRDYIDSIKIRISGIDYHKLENLNFFENTYYAIDETGYYFNANIKALAKMFTGDMGNVQLMGPVGIAKTITATEAISQFLLLMVSISLSLGIFNLFPIPALDGAKMVFVLIEWIRKKPINRDLENKIHMVGLIILFGFVILVDLLQLFT